MVTSPLTDSEAQNLRNQLARDVAVMLTYALEEGLELDPVVATLISGQDLSSTEQPVGDTGAQSLSSLMELHKSLAKAVAPATPCSLEATAPVSGYLGFLRR